VTPVRADKFADLGAAALRPRYDEASHQVRLFQQPDSPGFGFASRASAAMKCELSGSLAFLHVGVRSSQLAIVEGHL
jgi:hypothetical protein